MGIQENEIDSEMTDLKNFLPLVKNFEVTKRETQAMKVKEEDFRKTHTFTPDTKLTKGKVKPRPHMPCKKHTNSVTTLVSIDEPSISKKRPSESQDTPTKKPPRPIHTVLYSLRKRNIDQKDKTSDDFDVEKSQGELTF